MSRWVSGVVAVAALAAAGCKSVEREKAEARYAQANEWYMLSKYTEAKGLFKEAIDLTQGDYPEALVGLGNVYRELCKIESIRYIDGDEKKGIDVDRVRFLYTESEKCFRAALGLWPSYRDAEYGLGLLYYETAISKTIAAAVCRNEGDLFDFRWRKQVAARDRFEKAYALSPRTNAGAPQEYLALIYNFIGIEYAKRNDAFAAAEQFEKASASCSLYVTWVREQMRPTLSPQAFDFFEVRLREFEQLKADLAVSLGDVYVHLGAMQARGNDAPGAIAFYEKAGGCYERYLAWIRKQPKAVSGDVEFDKEKIQPVVRSREKVIKALSDLGKPTTPADPKGTQPEKR